jgi:death-on-curing protein
VIKVEQVLEIHSILIEKFGGSSGVRDLSLLESALGRPYQTFSGKELYPTPMEKSSAIIESVVKNHPFLDGNKRTGYVLGRLLLMNAGLDIHATQDDKYTFVINISTNQISFDEIRSWLSARVW